MKQPTSFSTFSARFLEFCHCQAPINNRKRQYFVFVHLYVLLMLLTNRAVFYESSPLKSKEYEFGSQLLCVCTPTTMSLPSKLLLLARVVYVKSPECRYTSDSTPLTNLLAAGYRARSECRINFLFSL